jgi:hypothetical protein
LTLAWRAVYSTFTTLLLAPLIAGGVVSKSRLGTVSVRVHELVPLLVAAVKEVT